MVISASGRVKGELTADKVIINGLFDGNCYASSVEILPQGKAHGVIHCDDLSIERGGSFLGKTLPTATEQVVSLPNTDGSQQDSSALEDQAKKG